MDTTLDLKKEYLAAAYPAAEKKASGRGVAGCEGFARGA